MKYENALKAAVKKSREKQNIVWVVYNPSYGEFPDESYYITSNIIVIDQTDKDKHRFDCGRKVY